MTEETSQRSWGTIAVILAVLSAVAFSVATEQSDELTVVLRVAGALLLAGALLSAYRA